jgi:FAD/FMN-containing dehydrogenase
VPDLVAALATCVGEAHVLTDPGVVAGDCTDWTRRWTGRTPAVVRPGGVDEVRAVIAVCREHKVALVPQGGNTGLVGGSVPLKGEVVLSTQRLDAIAVVDELGLQVIAGAGASLAGVQVAAAAVGLRFAVDLAARDTATIGGMVATNAGGTHVLRFGSMRAQLLGIEAVLGNGSVVHHMRGLRKDNTGYDLPGLLCGSEGTLGVITAVSLRLVPQPASIAVALVGFASIGDAVRGAIELDGAIGGVEALELMLADGLAIVAAHRSVALPSVATAPATVLVEVAGDAAARVEHLAGAVGALRGVVGEPAVALDAAGRARLWQLREAHPEAAAAQGIVHKLDVTLPAAVIEGFVADVRALCGRIAPGASCLIYGHVGDGNLHVNVAGAEVDDQVDEAILEVVDRAGGSISAEHGIGTAKKAWLERVRSPGDVAAFRAIKRALDPDGIMNPNALLP